MNLKICGRKFRPQILLTADEVQQKTLMQRTGELMADFLDDEHKVTDTETTIEWNLAVLKLKHTVKRR